jgi:hypothetical protein
VLGFHICEDQYFLVRVVFENLTGGVKTIQIPHANIQDQKVWSQLEAFSGGLSAIGGFTTNFPACVGSDEGGHTHPKYGMAISQQDAKGTHTEPSGKLENYSSSRVPKVLHPEFLKSAHDCSLFH